MVNKYIFSSGQKSNYFAYRVKLIRTLSALGPMAENYQANLFLRNRTFLNNLINSRKDGFTFDLRIISRPEPELPYRGKIEIVFICRCEVGDNGLVEDHRQQILRLLCVSFPEYEYEAVAAGKIPSFLCPFEIRHVSRIEHRVHDIRLDSLFENRPNRLIGFSEADFSKQANITKKRSTNSVIRHIFPFIYKGIEFDNLFNYLLLHHHPMAISCRLRPAVLTSGDEAFIERQIAKCEKALHAFPPHKIVLRTQVQSLVQCQTARLFALRANAVNGSIEIASPSPLPVSTVDMFGSLISTSGESKNFRTDMNFAPYLSGGYKIRQVSDVRGRDAFTNMEIMFPDSLSVHNRLRRLSSLHDMDETASFFRFPPSSHEKLGGVDSKNWRAIPSPEDVISNGTLLGLSSHLDSVQPITIGEEDRKRHVYIVGQTGTGKTTLMKTMIQDDIRSGKGVCIVDPHGDLYEDVLGSIPESRMDDVVLLDPTDAEFPVGLNLLECKAPGLRHFVAQELVGIIRRMMQDEYGHDTQMIGPIFFQHMRMNSLLAMSNSEDPGTLLDLYNIFYSKGYWKRWRPHGNSDPLLERWVQQVLPKTDYLSMTSDGMALGGYFGSKFEGFVFDPFLRNMFGQKKSKIDLQVIMNSGKILLVKLAKGELTEENSRFLGMIFISKLVAAAMGRATVPKSERRAFHVYVDEFQSIATEGFISLLSEGRKFGVSLTLANQFLSQIHDQRVMKAVFGNAGTIIGFRMGLDDAKLLEQKFFPSFNCHDIANLPNWNAYAVTLSGGKATAPFSFETIPDTVSPSQERAGIIRKMARSRYARTRAEAEDEIGRILLSEKDEGCEFEQILGIS